MAASLSESQSFFRAQRGSTRVNEDKRHTFFDCGVAGSCSSGVELRLRDATYNATTCFVEFIGAVPVERVKCVQTKMGVLFYMYAFSIVDRERKCGLASHCKYGHNMELVPTE